MSTTDTYFSPIRLGNNGFLQDAIRAAAVIVNRYHLNEYRLLIYGSLDKDPTYVSECRALISANNLQEQVTLMGLGNAPKVLTKGWIFVNSSLSEGLPLALGEAGLVSACPCNVGATARVVPLGELEPMWQQRQAGCGSCRGTILIPVVFVERCCRASSCDVCV